MSGTPPVDSKFQTLEREYCFKALDSGDAVHLGTESLELLIFGTKFQYSRKRRQDEERKQYDEATIRDLVITFCPTMYSVHQRKPKLLMPVWVKTEINSSVFSRSSLRLCFF